MNNILVSACLLGENVRYDAKTKISHKDCILKCCPGARLIPFCPEVAGGLCTPRPPAEIQYGDGMDVFMRRAVILTAAGGNVTAAFIKGAEIALVTARQQQVCLAILKQRSPSCGTTSIFDGTFSGTTKAGQGVTAALLNQHHIRCVSEEDLGKLASLPDSFP